jgi:O-antigen/teichoic acid export membrane protein
MSADLQLPSGSARNNAVWTVAGFGAMQVIRFASTLILSRLLFPDIFGLMALVNVFLQGLQMFTDVGIGPSIIQNKRGDEADFRNTAWTILVLRGLLLWFCSAAIAVPVWLLYPPTTPSLLVIIPAVGFSAVLNGLESTAAFTLRRRLVRAPLVILEVGAYALTMSLTIVWVYYVPTVWALVCSNLFSATVHLGASHFLIRGYRNRFRWEPAAFKELFHFGKWVFVSTLCTFLANQADKLLVGLGSLTRLGVYNFAAQLAAIPGQLMATLAWQLVFPLYSRRLQAGEEIQTVVADVHPKAAGVAAFLTAGLLGAGTSLVAFLYDSRYQDAGWMLQLLAIAIWFQTLETLESSVLWTLGRTRAPALSNASKLAALATLAPLGHWLSGFPGMLVGFVASDAVRYATTLAALRRERIGLLRIDLVLSLLITVSALAAQLVGAAFAGGTGSRMERFLPLALQAGVVAIIWAGVAVGRRHRLFSSGTRGMVVAINVRRVGTPSVLCEGVTP